MEHYETIKTEDTQGFHIVCSVAYEDIHPRDFFDDSVIDINDICHKIDTGEYQWFMVRVEAYKQGILLGTDYLGGCLYSTYDDFFIIQNAYYLDMVDNAINEAKLNLEKQQAEQDFKREVEIQTEAIVEREMNRLDKKLMQGHLSQADYDEQVKELDEWGKSF